MHSSKIMAMLKGYQKRASLVEVVIEAFGVQSSPLVELKYRSRAAATLRLGVVYVDDFPPIAFHNLVPGAAAAHLNVMLMRLVQLRVLP